MSFGDVRRLKRPRSTVTFVVVLQDDLHDALATRVAAPLVAVDEVAAPIRGLHPEVEVLGHRYRVLVNELASLPVTDLEPPLVDLAGQRAELLAAMDLLMTGI